jgi:hypothetical protein
MMERLVIASSITRPSRFRHYRRYLKPVLLAYGLLIPVALLLAATAPHRGNYPFPAEVILWHIMGCAATVVLGRIILAILELFKCRRRLRIRGEFFFKLMSFWPVLGCFTMAFLKTIRIA